MKHAGNVSFILTFIHNQTNPVGYCTYEIGYCCDGEKAGGDGKPCGHALGNDLNRALWASVEDLFMLYEVDVHITAHEHVYERTKPVYRYGACPGTSREVNQETQYIDPVCPLYVSVGSSGNQEVFPNLWMRQPEWSSPPRFPLAPNIFGFLNITFENSAEAPYSGSTLHMRYEAASDKTPGKPDEFPVDHFAIVRSTGDSQARRQSRQFAVQRSRGSSGLQQAEDMYFAQFI